MFRHVTKSPLLQEFALHDIAKPEVQRDIETYLASALSEIAMFHSPSPYNLPWPPEEELQALLTRSDGLFIYAATAIRYIGAQGVNFRGRSTEIVRPGPTPMMQIRTIDNLFRMIMNQTWIY